MHKQFLLVCIIIFNLSMYSQVVIKEEIVLDDSFLSKDGIESTGIIIPMPFYGRISSSIPCWTGNGWVCGWLRKHRVAGSQVWDTGCWDAECDQSCFQGIGSDARTFYNVTAGTEFTVEVTRSINNICYNVPLRYTGGTNNIYDIEAWDVQINDWVDIGGFSFIADPPPGCEYADVCTTGFSTIMPDTLTVNQPLNFTADDECAPYIDAQGISHYRFGVFDMVKSWQKTSNMIGLLPEDVEVCFDLQTQEWKFKLLVENITLNYVTDICLDNIQNPPVNATPVYSLSQIQNIPKTECDKLLKSLEAHTTWPIGNDVFGGYIFTEILKTHEAEHNKDWNGYVRRFVNNYFNIPEKINYICESFSSTQQAREVILAEIKKLFASDF